MGLTDEHYQFVSGLSRGSERSCDGTALEKANFVDPTDSSNYHPVSNFSFLGKVVERTVAKQLQGFLDEAVALDPFYCLRHRTETVLVTLR